MATGFRPIDLARLAGISAQQVRNYADDGILPPAARSPAGYRRFDERHREALLTYRSIATGFGWDTARRIMRAVHDGELPEALALVDATHAALHEQRRALRATAEALEAVARQDPDADPPPRSALRIGEAAVRLGVRPSALRVWESAGLLVPGRESGTGYRVYGAPDLRDARMIAMLRQARYPLTRIRPVLQDLRHSGSTAALREAITDRHRALAARSRSALDAASRLSGYLGG